MVDIDLKNNEMINIFSKAKTINQVKEIYKNYPNELPKISKTNCEEVSSFCLSQLKFSNFESTRARFIIFNNVVKNESQVKPIAWIQFTDRNMQRIRIKLDYGKYFAGKYIFVKLIDCENMSLEFGEFDQNVNIDLNYISLLGGVIEIL